MAEQINFAQLLAEAGPELEQKLAQDQQSGGLYTLIPVGQYRAEIIKAEPLPTSSNGNEGTLIIWKIKGGAQDGRTVRERVWYVFSSDKGKVTFFRKFAARGLGADFFARNPSQEQIEAALIGKVAIIKVEHEPWASDKTRISANVAWVNPDTGQDIPDPAPRPATASGAFGGVPTQVTGGAAPAAPTPAPVIPTPNLTGGPSVAGRPTGL